MDGLSGRPGHGDDAARSHFDAQDYLESGTPGVKSTADGWLNRYLQRRETASTTSVTSATSLSAFQAVAISPQLPRVLQGRATALAMRDIDRFGIRGPVAGAVESEYAQAADRVLNGVGRDAFDAIKTLRHENGNRGTDHGHGNAMMILGGGVTGGKVYGQWPGLAAHQRFESRDLGITTDFRDVFAEIVVCHLGLQSTDGLFPGWRVDEVRFPGLFRTRRPARG